MPSLSSFCAGPEPLEPVFDQKGGDAARPGIGPGLGIDDQGLRVMAVGDPQLRTVQDVAVALSVGAQPHRDDIRAGLGLAHGERTDMLARDQLRQVFALLRLAAVAPDLVDAEVRMRTVGEADRSRGAAHFLHRDAMRQIAHAGAAVFFLDGDPVQAECPHFRPQLDREAVGPVDLGGERGDAVLGKAAHRRPQHVDLGAEVKVERRKPRVLHGSEMAASIGAVEKTRTSTEFPPQRPQRCASTNSATTARQGRRD